MASTNGALTGKLALGLLAWSIIWPTGAALAQSAADTPQGPVALALQAIRGALKVLHQRVGEIAGAIPETPAQIERMFQLMTDFEGWPALIRALALMIVVFVFAGTLEFGLRRFARPQRFWPRNATNSAARIGIGDRLTWSAINLAALALFLLATIALSLVFFHVVDPLRDLVTTTAAARVGVQGLWILARLIAARPPGAVSAIGGLALCGMLFSGLMQLYGLNEPLAALFEIAVSLVALGLALARLGTGNDRDTGAAISPPAEDLARSRKRRRAKQAVSFGIVVLWLLWLANLLFLRSSGTWAAAAAAAVLLLLLHVSQQAVEYRAALASRRELHSARHSALRGLFIGLALLGRIGLGGIAVVLAAEAAGIAVFAFLATPTGGALRSAIVNSAIAIAIGYVAWAMMSYWIDRKLAEESDDAGASDAAVSEGEGGTARVGTRAETLLPLFRSFATIVILAIVALSVLSSIGVDIAPLLAGAGVVGIAIGFGAQSLVKDVVSGVFFLIDDAFRIGEYVEFGDLRGEVEKISIRSLGLRHHRGAIHTVPFGEIKAITNYNRDWVIMKLKISLKYGTDIEQVRKLVKRIGKEMMEHPDYGKLLLEPPKSQGILEFGDYGVILRVKFKSRPREQFVLRRVINERLNVEFAKNGIEFAYPTVTIDSAEGAAEKMPVSAAAGQAALQQIERQRA